MVTVSELSASAADAARLMKALSNEHRLLILCHLIENDEMSVGALVDEIGLSQSALSQHLAKLRAQGLVSYRRESQTLHYRVCDERAATVILLLYDIFCSDPGSKVRKTPMARSSPRRDKKQQQGG